MSSSRATRPTPSRPFAAFVIQTPLTPALSRGEGEDGAGRCRLTHGDGPARPP